MERPIRYHVHMDYPGFREYFTAANRRYMRKAGFNLAVWMLLPILILMAAAAEETQGFRDLNALNPDTVWGLLFFFALFAAGLSLGIRPAFLLKTRGLQVRAWFAAHSSAAAHEAAGVIYDRTLDSLQADYEVVLEDYGFLEIASEATGRSPWFTLDGRMAELSRGVYFTIDAGAQDSLLHNMAGFNWLQHEDHMAGILFIPREVLAQHSGLAGRIRQQITGARKRYLAAGRPRTVRLDDPGLIAWLKQE